MSALQKIKSGKKNYKLIDFPGTEIKVALVLLSSNQTTLCKLKAEEYNEKHKITDPLYIDVTLQQYLTHEFLRDCDDRDKKLVDTIDEIRELDNGELSYLVSQYTLMTQETSPFLNSVTEEQFDILKKTLPEIQLSDLSGECLVSLRNFLMSLV